MNHSYRTTVEIGSQEKIHQGLKYTEVAATVIIETADEGLHDWIIDVLRDLDRDYNN